MSMVRFRFSVYILTAISVLEVVHSLTVLHIFSSKVNTDFVLANFQVFTRQSDLFTLENVWVFVVGDFLIVDNNL